MKWRFDISREAEKFLDRNETTIQEITLLVVKAILYFQREDANIDIKKLKGEWRGFYRIRSGKLRVTAEFNFEDSVVFVERIDWRGNAYK